MDEYLELLANGLSDAEIATRLNAELPGLEKRLHVQDGAITTKLSAREDVFFTFDKGARVWVVEDDEHEATRYLTKNVYSFLEPTTLARERPGPGSSTHLLLSDHDLESTMLYQGAYPFTRGWR